MRKISTLSRSLQWALLGFTFSIISNSIFAGSVVPSILIVGLPAWALAFNNTFGVVTDFLSPASAWLVEKIGSFKALAGAEFCEGILCLIVALIPQSVSWWKWCLLTLGCVLLITGQIIDIAGEIFEVDLAAGNENMLITYSGVMSIIMSVAGALLGRVLGSALTSLSVIAMLMASSLLSFACAATRLISRSAMPHSVTTQLHESDDGTSEERTQIRTPERKRTSWKQRVILLSATFLVTLSSSFYGGYVILGYANDFGTDVTTTIYVATGVGSVLGSLAYAHFSSRTSLKNNGVLGTLVLILGVVLLLVGHIYAALIGWFFATFGATLATNAIVVSRQLIIERDFLTRFSGLARLASALASTLGSWIGWSVSSFASWHVLPALAFVTALLLVPVVWTSLHAHTISRD